MRTVSSIVLLLTTQSKSETQSKDVCTVTSIVLQLTLIGHNMVFISFTRLISLISEWDQLSQDRYKTP